MIWSKAIESLSFTGHLARLKMVSVASLLNPLPTSLSKESGAISAELSMGNSLTVSPTSPKVIKNKMSKSAAIFIKGRAKGAINYKPYETQDEKITTEHHKFQLEPTGRISDYPRHIPYSSDKKSFQKRTGRDAFEGDDRLQRPRRTEAYNLQRINTHSVSQGTTPRKTLMP